MSNVICLTCQEIYPYGSPHTCGKPPFYVAPGLGVEDKQVVSAMDANILEALTRLQTTLDKLDLNENAQTWVKNKIQAILANQETIITLLNTINGKLP